MNADHPKRLVITQAERIAELEKVLREMSERIDKGSGTASWTAREHDAILLILDKVKA